MAYTVTLNDKGLVPAIAQHAETGDVLMLGYMSPGSVKRTLEGGDVWFYSRSREELWHKGELSGNYLHLRSAALDCDGDVVLLQVEPDGPVCHTGNDNCFFTAMDEVPVFVSSDSGSGVLDELFAVVQERKRDMPEGSYTAELLREGVDRVGQKVIEEAGEVVIAGLKEGGDRLAEEMADLLYHMLVLMAAAEIRPEDVWTKLRERRA